MDKKKKKRLIASINPDWLLFLNKEFFDNWRLRVRSNDQGVDDVKLFLRLILRQAPDEQDNAGHSRTRREKVR